MIPGIAAVIEAKKCSMFSFRLCVLLCAVTGFVWQTKVLVEDYLRYPTVLDIRNSHIALVYLPGVTFCISKFPRQPSHHRWVIKSNPCPTEDLRYLGDSGLKSVEVQSSPVGVVVESDLLAQEGRRDRRGRSHPPQFITSREDRQFVRMAVTDRSVTSRSIAQHIESVTHHSVSAHTIRRRLQLLLIQGL
ncbi:HTH_Tnp_Tc3_2 domain-containing protein [Trichonephila clavipes]|nr:HTH_Tnp_Tc3_2 domain-containing protein [Trichonephila clavipes]